MPMAVARTVVALTWAVPIRMITGMIVIARMAVRHRKSSGEQLGRNGHNRSKRSAADKNQTHTSTVANATNPGNVTPAPPWPRDHGVGVSNDSHDACVARPVTRRFGLNVFRTHWWHCNRIKPFEGLREPIGSLCASLRLSQEIQKMFRLGLTLRRRGTKFIGNDLLCWPAHDSCSSCLVYVSRQRRGNDNGFSSLSRCAEQLKRQPPEVRNS